MSSAILKIMSILFEITYVSPNAVASSYVRKKQPLYKLFHKRTKIIEKITKQFDSIV